MEFRSRRKRWAIVFFCISGVEVTASSEDLSYVLPEWKIAAMTFSLLPNVNAQEQLFAKLRTPPSCFLQKVLSFYRRISFFPIHYTGPLLSLFDIYTRRQRKDNNISCSDSPCSAGVKKDLMIKKLFQFQFSGKNRKNDFFLFSPHNSPCTVNRPESTKIIPCPGWKFHPGHRCIKLKTGKRVQKWIRRHGSCIIASRFKFIPWISGLAVEAFPDASCNFHSLLNHTALDQ